MDKQYRTGAIGALLDEYEKALHELMNAIDLFSDKELAVIADSNTRDENCISVQTVLAHVVRSGFAYALFIQHRKGPQLPYPDRLLRNTVQEYKEDLRRVFDYTIDVFSGITDDEIEELDNKRKITSSWGQLFDIEQLMEHAIVHILRHRRQLERFKLILEKIKPG